MNRKELLKHVGSMEHEVKKRGMQKKGVLF